jgi:phosphohistidine phosphatase
MRAAAKGMRKYGLSFDLILSSPYVRARDTADIVAHAFTNRRHLKLTKLLEPTANQRHLVQHLAALRRAHSILLVGHEPDLSTLLATLLGARFPDRFKLKKGALCLLAIEKLRHGPCARMEWLLTSKQLARLAP